MIAIFMSANSTLNMQEVAGGRYLYRYDMYDAV